MVQAAAEGAGHTGVARRIGGHQTVVDPRCAGVVAELLLGLASFEQRHRREIIIGHVAGELQQLRGGVSRQRRQRPVVAGFHGLIAIRELRQVRLKIRPCAFEVPEEVADDARVEAILGTHAAQLLQQYHRIWRHA